MKKRSEKEMMDMILAVADKDERIRAVSIGGSRVFSYIEKDELQDFDIVYYVTEPSPFINNLNFISQFGKRAILQMPAPFGEREYVYLMQFTDGNRIDLSIKAISSQKTKVSLDPDERILLDKDGLFKYAPPVDQTQYNIEPPSRELYEHCCNEFWWLQLYIVKGILRQELSYAMGMLNIVRKEFQKMIVWDIGLRQNFNVSAGKLGKYIEKYLTQKEWQQFKQTYPSCDYKAIRNSITVMQDMFRKSALKIAEHFGFCYPSGDDKGVCKLIKTYKQ